MTADTHAHIAPDPAPATPRRLRSRREIAGYVASEFNERGHDLSASDVLDIVDAFQAQIRSDFGHSVLVSGKLR